MSTTYVILVALSCFSFASAYYWVGERHPDSDLVLAHSEHYDFEEGKARIMHINTCGQNEYKIHQIEVSTHHGQTLTGRLNEGGPGHYYAYVELYGKRGTTFEVKVWGEWVGGKREDVDTEKGLQFYDNKWPCSHEVY